MAKGHIPVIPFIRRNPDRGRVRTDCLQSVAARCMFAVAQESKKEIPMKCDICGQDYGVAHNCPGVVAASMTQEEAAPFPTGFAPLYYLRLAFNIARWDDVSIRRASRDSNAGIYGVALWAIAAMTILGFTALPQMLRTIHASGPTLIIGLGVGLIFGLVVMGLITLYSAWTMPSRCQMVLWRHGNSNGCHAPLAARLVCKRPDSDPGSWALGIRDRLDRCFNAGIRGG